MSSQQQLGSAPKVVGSSGGGSGSSKKRKSTSATTSGGGASGGGGPKKKANRRKTKSNSVSGPASNAAAVAAALYTGQQGGGGGQLHHTQQQHFTGSAGFGGKLGGNLAITAVQRAAATKALADRSLAATSGFDRRNDPAWLAKENIATAVDTHRIQGEEDQRSKCNQLFGAQQLRQNRTASLEFLKDEAKIVDRALEACGMDKTQITQEAYACFMEYARRNACELVADAQDYALHCGRHEISSADLKLASWNQQDDGDGDTLTKSSWYLPPLDKLSELAEQQNKIPLPPIPSHCYNGIVLPPLENQVTARTFDVVSSARASHRFVPGSAGGLVIDPPSPRGNSALSSTTASKDLITPKDGENHTSNNSDPNATNNLNKPGSYGANKGKQVSVTIGGVTSGPSKHQIDDAGAMTAAASNNDSAAVSGTRTENPTNDTSLPDISEQF